MACHALAHLHQIWFLCLELSIASGHSSCHLLASLPFLTECAWPSAAPSASLQVFFFVVAQCTASSFTAGDVHVVFLLKYMTLKQPYGNGSALMANCLTPEIHTRVWFVIKLQAQAQSVGHGCFQPCSKAPSKRAHALSTTW